VDRKGRRQVKMATKKKEKVVSTTGKPEKMAKISQDTLDLLLNVQDEMTRQYGILAVQLRQQARRINNQRYQLQMYEEKMELMKSWAGVARTIGQKLHLCK
jgi:hypothetical protein